MSSISVLLRVHFTLEAGVLDSVALLKAQVEPVSDASGHGGSPGKPDVDGRGHILQIAGTLSVLIGKNHLREENTRGQPSVATLNWVFLALHGSPSLSINVGLAMSNGSEAKPEKKASNREEVLRRDQQSVVHEEPCKEVDQ